MKILFICTGNICRSPTAHGLFLSLILEEQLHEIIEVDSAGIGSWNIGSPPNLSAQMIAQAHGIDITNLRARRLIKEDYNYYDYIVAMDKTHLNKMLSECEKHNQHKLKLLLEYADDTETIEVLDPYGEGINGFEIVYKLIEQGCLGLLCSVKKEITKSA